MQEAEHFLSAQNKLGEGAVWCPAEQALYWVDIHGHSFQRLHRATKACEVFEVGEAIGVLALRAAGGLIMATEHGFATWDFAGSQLTYLVHPEADQPHKRFNDGAVDCKGRFWAGTMSETATERAEGVLYRFDPDGSLYAMDTGLWLPNGLGWSPDTTLMYATDSLAKTIYVYDFDAASGEIANRRPFIVTPDEPGVPDGLTIDDDGFLWSARWNGWKITRYDPAGKVEREIRVPVSHPTSCAFGGPNRDELFITTAWTALSVQKRQNQPQAGDLFHIQTTITGPARPSFLG